MKLTHSNGSDYHLSYCSNIHPGETWQEVRQNLETFLPKIRHQLNPNGEFGIGLRLSAEAANTLAEKEVLCEFKNFLAENHLYVFTINGFPYGQFHGIRVKEDVYLPDWKDEERLAYTNKLTDLFAELLPPDQTGSISTVPGAFKSCVLNLNDINTMVHNLIKHVAHLVEIEQRTGKCVVLAIEPEPCCFLETIDESIAFFSNFLFSENSQQQLAELTGVTLENTKPLLQKHLTLCLDLCHAAVEFECYDTCVTNLRNAGVEIGKIQISAGLQLSNVSLDSIDLLKPFEDNVYLHQVVEKRDGELNRYPDLAVAFSQLSDDGIEREWRVHFHVPVFLDNMGSFSSTQFFVKEALDAYRIDPISPHLEVETYTWNVLPESFRTESIEAAIVREINWVKDRLS